MRAKIEDTLDLIVVGTNAAGDGQLTIMNGDGLGGFVKSQTLKAGHETHSVSVADLDHDGDLDIVYSNQRRHGEGYSIALNDGHGHYSVTAQGNLKFGAATTVFAHDIDSDGDADLVFSQNDKGSVAILRNDGTGHFAAADYQSVAAVAGQQNSNIFLEITDGFVLTPDIYSVSGDLLAKYINDDEGSFSYVNSVSVGQPILGMNIMDYGSDATYENVVSTGWKFIFMTDLESSGQPTVKYTQYMPAGQFATAFDVGDVNGDIMTDIVTANRDTDSYTILAAKDSGGFTTVTHNLDKNSAPTDVRIADLDNNGDTDILLALSGTGNVAVLLNNGDGTFKEIDTPKNSGMNLDDIYLGLINNDIQGSKKADTLKGTAAADLITAMGGNDKITAGKGVDEISTGEGKDTVIFTHVKDAPTGDNIESITDFVHGKDKLDFSKLDPATKDGAFDFIGEHNFHGRAGEIRFAIHDGPVSVADHTYIQLDFDGNGKADMELDLKGIVHLDGGDFVL